MGDEEREALAEALYVVWDADVATLSDFLEAMWPVVDAIARRRAAEELRRVADWIWDDVPARASASAELHARADEVDSQ